MKNGIKDLERLISILRSEKGCPWDREQDLQNLRSFFLEETYEVIDAINEGNIDKLKEELGDLLFQIVFAAQIGREEGIFSLEEIIALCHQKMVRRHPHVFGDKKANNSQQVLKQWEDIKKSEKSAKDKKSDLKNSISLLPALLKTHMLTSRGSRFGFDWEKVEQVIEKLREELSELQRAIKLGNKMEIEHEMGDVLFAAANVSRFLDINPEIALQKINETFIQRVAYIEEKLKECGKTLETANLAEMDALWEEAKKNERKKQ